MHRWTGSPSANGLAGTSCPIGPTRTGPGSVAAQRSEALELQAAVDALPEKYRVVITLYHLQGKQYEEIAKVLGLPLGTVKTHLHRAKEMLRTRLAGTLA